MLQTVFINLCSGFTGDATLIDRMWTEIRQSYSGKKRHYHNLDHISSMLTQLESCRHLVGDWEGTLFASFYHDMIYDATSRDNEEKSAVEAGKKLKPLGIPADMMSRVTELILATKSHNVSANADVNLFTDADLSILGSSEAEYERYRSNVRREYSIYPDLLYKPGRKKVLQHFLEMPFIFKTEFFRAKLEIAARANINSELNTL